MKTLDPSPPENLLAFYLDAFWPDTSPFELAHNQYFKKSIWRPDFLLSFYSKQISVECDGFSYHNNDYAFERDRAKDRSLWTLNKIPTLRFTAKEVTTGPANVLIQIYQAMIGPPELDTPGMEVSSFEHPNRGRTLGVWAQKHPMQTQDFFRAMILNRINKRLLSENGSPRRVGKQLVRWIVDMRRQEIAAYEHFWRYEHPRILQELDEIDREFHPEKYQPTLH